MTEANTQAAPQTQAEARKPLRGIQTGVVTSDKRDKSRTVKVAFTARHAKYGKYVRKMSSFQVHDPENASKLGDQVQIAPCRPVSKTKNWRLVKVVAASAGQEEHVR